MPFLLSFLFFFSPFLLFSRIPSCIFFSVHLTFSIFLPPHQPQFLYPLKIWIEKKKKLLPNFTHHTHNNYYHSRILVGTGTRQANTVILTHELICWENLYRATFVAVLIISVIYGSPCCKALKFIWVFYCGRHLCR